MTENLIAVKHTFQGFWLSVKCKYINILHQAKGWELVLMECHLKTA